MTSKLITPESPLLVPPLLAAEIGLYEALILQQIHYYCLSSKHVKSDGRHWFWKTLTDWRQTLPFLKPSTIRRAIANLKDKFKLIDIEQHSRHTWYQANWFTINVEAVESLWNSICQNQQIDVQPNDTSICSNPADQIKDYSTKTSSTQQQAAEVELVFEEPDWNGLAKKTAEWEATQLGIETEPPKSTDYVNDNLNYTTNTENPQEGHSSAPDENNNQNLITTFGGVEFKTVKHEPVTPSQPINNTAISVQGCTRTEWLVIEGEEAIDSIKPSVTTEEMRNITNQLRNIPCTPAFRVNPQVQACIRKNWQNVQNAIAFIKEQIVANAKPKKSWEAWFVFAVAEGLKPEKEVAPSNFRAWFDAAYKQGLVIASELRSDGVTGVCLSEKVANSLGVGEWVRFEKAVELLQQVQRKNLILELNDRRLLLGA